MSNIDPTGFDSPNPFQPPAGQSPLHWEAEPGPVSLERSIQLLAATRPWVMGMASLCFLCAFVFSVRGARFAAYQLWESGTINLLAGGLYAASGFYLGNYAKQIRLVYRSNAVDDFEKALAAQRSFWRFCGIMAISLMVLGLIGVFVAADVAQSEF